MIDIEFSPREGDCSSCNKTFPVLNVLVISSGPSCNLRFTHALCENCLNTLPETILQKCKATPPMELWSQMTPEWHRLHGR